MRAFESMAALAALSLAAGCAAVRSTQVDFGGRAARDGLQYAAPKGLFRIELIARGGDIFLAVSEPIFVGDPDATYMLEASSGLLANQEYLFVVNPKTRLLSYVNSSSEGQAGQILQNLARSISGAGVASEENSAGQGPERVIYSRIVDPFALAGCDFGAVCDFRVVNEQLRAAALSHFDCAASGASGLCAQIAADPHFFRLQLDPLFDDETGGVERGASANACRRSICYRSPAPYSMSLRVGGLTDVSELVNLPNEAPIMSLSIPAGVFADSRARVEMFQGMPARYVADRDNELVAITLLPFQLVKEGFAAVGEVLQFRINYNNRRVDQLASETRRENAERQREAQLGARRTARAENEDNGLIGDRAENSASRPMEDDTGASAEPGSEAALAPSPPERRLFEVQLSGSPAAAESGNGADLGGS